VVANDVAGEDAAVVVTGAPQKEESRHAMPDMDDMGDMGM
jgi:hypothetical protein